MSFAKVLVVLCLSFASVSSLATPHAVRHNPHHRAIAARVAVPEPLAVPALPLRKRQNTRRCKQRSSSAAQAASTHASSSVVQPTPITTTPAAQTTQASRPTTTTKAAAPTTVIKKTTTTPAPVAATTTHTAAAPTTTAQKSSGSSSNLPSFLVGTQTGEGTFYSTGLGACGITNTDSQHIAAVSHLLYDNFPGYNGVNPNTNPLCGRTVTATYQGKSVVVALTDRCTGCALTDLDFSPSAFNELADFSVGRLFGVTWVWN